MRIQQAVGAIGTAALVLLATACGTADEPRSSATESPTVGNSSAASIGTTPTPTQTPSLPEPEISLPPGPEPGTDAAVAWEALMSPTGEYAAAAHYAAVIDAFGAVEPYVTIEAAEQRHIDALTRQLERDGVDVPANPYLGYVEAPADLQAAAEAWATGEVSNVAMYDALLSQSADAQLTKVLNNLRRASQDVHLPLFTTAAANGGTLTAEQMQALPG